MLYYHWIYFSINAILSIRVMKTREIESLLCTSFAFVTKGVGKEQGTMKKTIFSSSLIILGLHIVL